jgi:hypothetical protein
VTKREGIARNNGGVPPSNVAFRIKFKRVESQGSTLFYYK